MSRKKVKKSSLKIAVPVQSDGVRLYLQKGRLWTAIEHSLLVYVSGDPVNTQKICEDGKLPIAVVQTAVLRLMNAGWIELVIENGKAGFRATEHGRMAASYDRLPRVSREISRHEYFVVDQIVGGAYRRSECSRLYWKQHLPEDALVLEREILYTPTTKACVVEELVREDETLVNFATEKEHIRREQYLLVELVGSAIKGLPLSASRKIIDAIKQRSSGSITVASQDEGNSEERSQGRAYRVAFEDRQLVTGGEKHRELITDFLMNAKQYVLIHSTFLAARAEQLVKKHRELLPLLKQAVEAGVQVDILWGQNETEGQVVYEAWNTFILENGFEELVRLHRVSTLSHAKFLLADFGGGRFRLALGSCNWLASPFRKFEVTIVLEDQRFVGRFLREFSDKLRGHHLHVEGEFHKSAFLLSGELLRKGEHEFANSDAELVVGPDHQRVFLEYVDNARHRLVVASHRMSRNSLNAIFAPLEADRLSKGVQVEIYFEILSDLSLSELRGIQKRVPAVRIMRLAPRSFHGKFLCKDSDDVVVTSQNMLSATPGHQVGFDEIGMRIKRRKLANVLRSRFSHISNQAGSI